MSESPAHKTLKTIAKAILRTKGYSHTQIEEEINIGGTLHGYRVDVGVYETQERDSIIAAAECGNCPESKLHDLDDALEYVVYLDYGAFGVPDTGMDVSGLKIDVEKVRGIDGLSRELTYEVLKT